MNVRRELVIDDENLPELGGALAAERVGFHRRDRRVVAVEDHAVFERDDVGVRAGGDQTQCGGEQEDCAGPSSARSAS